MNLIVKNEPILDDNYLMHGGYLYVVDDKVTECEIFSEGLTVKHYKNRTGAKQIRRCDILARQEERDLEKSPISQSLANKSCVPDPKKRVNKYLKKASHF